MARVALDNLTKTFRSPTGEPVRAVSGANLVVEDREFLALVGPSGCGKTTLLRLVAGLERPDAGTVALDGRVVNDLEPNDRDVAMVFQHHALFPHLTVFENLALGLRLRKVPAVEIRRRVDEVAALLGLGDLLERPPRALSGGQRQRVALGRAMVRQPRVFLLDEPFSQLDPRLRVQMRLEVRRLHRRLAATVIHVTHDQAEAMTLGDRVAVMQDGLLRQVADPLTLYRQPNDLFTAGFIGAPPMNLLTGRLEGTADALRFRSIPAGETGAPGVVLRLAGPPPGALGQRIGQPVVLGLRPEHVRIVTAQPAQGTLALPEARVELVEPLGFETWCHLDLAGEVLVARTGPECGLTVGQPVRLDLDLSQARFFDPATGNAIG